MRRRHGFTLVELMVSMALIIFIMAILSQAFAAALGVFRNLKGQGDLAEKLRATAQILQHDLAADHFGSNRRLSDPTFWNNGPPQQGFFHVYQGSISTGTGPSSFIEGADLSGILSYRSTDHKLAFAVRLIGNDIGDFMSASAYGSGNVWDPNQVDPATGLPPKPVVPELPGNPVALGPTYGLGLGAIGIDPAKPVSFGPPESRYQPLVGAKSITGYNSQWAAVAWFLQPQINPTTGVQDQTAPDPSVSNPATGLPPYPGVPLYQLYRRQVLLVPDNNLVSLATIPQGVLPPYGIDSSKIGNFLEMSCFADPKTNKIYFNNPSDITMPANRVASWGGQPAFTPIPVGPLLGSDIQLNDVVSFDVRVLPLYPVGTTPPNPADPFVTLYDPPFSTVFKTTSFTTFFDTWSSFSNGIPGSDYSNWSTPGTATSIPLWTTNPVSYQYPVGTGQTITLPGAATMYQSTGSGPTSQATGSGPIIRALQITIRIWDFKTNQTRQVTIVQAM